MTSVSELLRMCPSVKADYYRWLLVRFSFGDNHPTRAMRVNFLRGCIMLRHGIMITDSQDGTGMSAIPNAVHEVSNKNDPFEGL